MNGAMLSQTSEYALRAVVGLAQRAGESLTTGELADLTGVPRDYLAKVLRQLSRVGIVAAHRGLRGGFRLSRPAAELTALDVVEAIDPLPRITTCPLGRGGHGTDLCPLHRTLQRINLEVREALAVTLIADLVAAPATVSSLCPTSDSQRK